MKQLSVLCFIFLIGCSATNQKSNAESNNVSHPTTMSPEKRQMLNNISKWVRYARSNIERFIGDTSSFLGDSVKIELEINENCTLKYVNVLNSSGNISLERTVSEAVKQASPFNTRMLSSEEFDEIKIMKISFDFR